MPIHSTRAAWLSNTYPGRRSTSGAAGLLKLQAVVLNKIESITFSVRGLPRRSPYEWGIRLTRSIFIRRKSWAM